QEKTQDQYHLSLNLESFLENSSNSLVHFLIFDFQNHLNHFESSFKNNNQQFLDKQFSYFSHLLMSNYLIKSFCSFAFRMIEYLIRSFFFYNYSIFQKANLIRNFFRKFISCVTSNIVVLLWAMD